LHGDVTSRIAHIANAESLILDELRVTVSQRFASKGSFARGEAVGLVFELAWEINIVTEESEARVSSVVDRALRTSPANAAMVTGKESRFALSIDGRATPSPDCHNPIIPPRWTRSCGIAHVRVLSGPYSVKTPS